MEVELRRGQGVDLGNDIRLYFLKPMGAAVSLGVRAPRHVPVDRLEVWEKKQRLAEAMLERARADRS